MGEEGRVGVGEVPAHTTSQQESMVLYKSFNTLCIAGLNFSLRRTVLYFALRGESWVLGLIKNTTIRNSCYNFMQY
jgi:hypothetical protein